MKVRRGSSRTGLGGRLAVALMLLAFGASVAGEEPEAAGPFDRLVFELDRYNDTYTGVMTETQPIVRGPLTVRLSSRRSDLTLEAHRLELEPAEDGLHRGVVWGRFHGEGDLEADVELGTIPATFDDRVRILEQEKRIPALVDIEPRSDDYLVTFLDLPASVSVAIESDLVGSLVSFCKRFSLFVVGDAGCRALDELLSNPKLPLAERGSSVVVDRGYFTAEELGRLDGYLAAHPRPVEALPE